MRTEEFKIQVPNWQKQNYKKWLCHLSVFESRKDLLGKKGTSYVEKI